jgi:hypothetical protein
MEDLVKFGYKLDMKVIKNIYIIIFGKWSNWCFFCQFSNIYSQSDYDP